MVEIFHVFMTLPLVGESITGIVEHVTVTIYTC